jgi:CheY-like chemotaxis protein
MRNVLVIEDNPLIGLHMVEIVRELGHNVLGPLTTRGAAIEALDEGAERPDAVILDLHLDGISLDVADELRAQAIPFVFATGNRDAIPPAYRLHPVCEKPFTARELLASLDSAFGQGR